MAIDPEDYSIELTDEVRGNIGTGRGTWYSDSGYEAVTVYVSNFIIDSIVIYHAYKNKIKVKYPSHKNYRKRHEVR